MNIGSFIEEETRVLIAQLSSYLNQEIDHKEIQAHIDRVFNKWETLNINEKDPYTNGEKAFWCSIWSAQHLASEDHWEDGVAQSELGLLLKVLKGECSLPSIYVGNRP